MIREYQQLLGDERGYRVATRQHSEVRRSGNDAKHFTQMLGWLTQRIRDHVRWQYS